MPRLYYPDGTFRDVEHINAYLLPGSDIFVEARPAPMCQVPPMIFGSMPNDGGNLILSEDERAELLKKCPQAGKYIRQFLGAEEFIHNKKRYCLWLVDCPPDELRKMKPVYERVKQVKILREKSSRKATQKLAETPHLFGEIRQPTSEYILVPSTSSENRKYIPMDFVKPEIICSNANLMIPKADLWHFGILQSSVHMIWTSTVCGRLENRYRYSAQIVYNNFVWMRMHFEDFAALWLSAKKILDVRKNYPNASLADLYDETAMPKDLRDAHRENDKIVMKIYGFNKDMTEEDIAINLLERYDFLKNYQPPEKTEDDEDESQNF